MNNETRLRRMELQGLSSSSLSHDRLLNETKQVLANVIRKDFTAAEARLMCAGASIYLDESARLSYNNFFDEELSKIEKPIDQWKKAAEWLINNIK